VVNVRQITEAIDHSHLEIKTIVLTHGHSDHMAALYDTKSYTKAAIAVHAADSHVLHGKGESNNMFGID